MWIVADVLQPVYHPVTMPYAPVNGVDLYYEEHGKGFPLVLAHGAGGNHLSWWQQVPHFSRHYRTITFDHRGWGLSLDEDDRGAEAFVDDLHGLLDHLEIERAILVGQSMGGFSCLGLTLLQPERVAGLVMSNTFAGMRREVWLASSDDKREAVRAIWDRRRQDGIKRALAPGFAREHKERAFLYKQIRLLNEAGPNRLHSESQVLRLRALERSQELPATKERLAGLKVPVLFIGGEHDEVMPVSLMEVAHSLIPSSRMVVVPGTGHSVYFEAPEIFAHIASEFFASCLDVTQPLE
jgi:pimeloyl-ACP methyl ester carboxylesterase